MVIRGEHRIRFSVRARVGEPPRIGFIRDRVGRMSLNLEYDARLRTTLVVFGGIQCLGSSRFFILCVYHIGYLLNHQLSDSIVIPLISYPFDRFCYQGV